MTKLYPFIFFLAIISCHPKMSKHRSSENNSTIEKENLAYANYKFLHSAVKQPADVLKLKVWDYPFEELPMNLVFAKNLRYFELASESDLDFEHTKKIINGFSHLKEMSLIDNYFTELPFTPDSLPELEKLDLWKQDEIEMPKVISQLTQCEKLEKLTLYNISYSKIPESIKSLQSLKSIGLGSDNIDYGQHFNVLSTVPTLEALTVYGYQEIELAEGLGKLNLKELRFLNNRQLDYGKTFEQADAFKTLETLEISRVEGFTVLPKNIRQFKNLKELVLTQLRTSDSYDKSLNMESLSEDLLHLQNLEVLNLSSSDPNPNNAPQKAKRIPDNIRTLKKLKRLNLDNHTHLDMPHLVDVLSDLPDFEELSMEYISFANDPYGTKAILPQNFNEISSLKKLNLIDAGARLFDSMQSLPPKLTHLKLSFDSKNVPEIVLSHKNLISLSMQSSSLTSIPTEISDLSNLENLDLRDNQLTELPPQIAFLKNLRFLDLAGNPCAEDEAFQKQIKEWLPHTTIYFYE